MISVYKEKLETVSADDEQNRALLEVTNEREPLIQPELLPGAN